MAFSSLSSTLIQVGKPIIKSIFQTLKDNQDDLNTRVSSVEASASKIVLFSGPIYTASGFTSATGLYKFYVQSGMTITDAKVGVNDHTGVTSGTLEVDIQKASSLDFASSVSVFTTKPSLDMSTAGNYVYSSNVVLDNTNKVLSEGDHLRIDVSSLPTGVNSLQLYLIAEPA